MKQFRKEQKNIINMIKLEMMTIKEAAEEAGGNEQILQEMLDKLRQWLQQQLHLPQEISDEQIRWTLLTAKFNLEKAKKYVDFRCTLRNFIPDIICGYDPLSDSIISLYKSAHCLPLPRLTPEKYRVVILRWLSDDSSLFNPNVLLKYMSMIAEVRVMEDIVNHDICILDAKHFTWGHIRTFTPIVLKKYNSCLEIYSSRLKKIYVINAPTYMDYFLSIAKMFIKQKILDHIQIFESGVETLCDFIPKSILPADYGGDEPSMKTLTDMWHAKLMERRDWLLEQDKLKTDESLRTNSVINPDDLFGVTGTFRKLEID